MVPGINAQSAAAGTGLIGGGGGIGSGLIGGGGTFGAINGPLSPGRRGADESSVPSGRTNGLAFVSFAADAAALRAAIFALCAALRAAAELGAGSTTGATLPSAIPCRGDGAPR